MPTLNLGELAEMCGGKLVRGAPDRVVDSYAIDTRRIQRGGVFFALKGDRTDGHRFLDEALRNGAAAAVVESELAADEASPPALIRVENTERSLGQCGYAVRRKLTGVKWLAVTGSIGKTTTKEMLAAALSANQEVHRTPGNFNNHLGVPLTLLACPDKPDVAVLELAMSARGEIATLADMVDPDVGIVTNVRAAHLESLGSLDEIAAAKGELFAVMRDDATSVVNLDDSQIRVQAARHVGPRITFGRNTRADVRLEGVVNQFLPGAELTFRFDGKAYTVRLRIGGSHAALDALAALAAVIAAGGDLDSAIGEIEKVEPEAGRGRQHHLAHGMILIDDSYNSNPAALASVLDTLRVSEPTGRKILVVGDMLELGHLRGALHREAGKRAGAAGVHLLVAVGTESRATAEVARRSGVPEVHHHGNSSKAAEEICDLVKEGDLIVIKGSRSMHMERVVQALTGRFGKGGH